MAQIRLTPRQQMAIVGIAQGLRVGEVSRRIQCSKATIYRDLAEVAKRVSLRDPTMAGLVIRARDAGLVSPNLRLSESGQIVLTPGAAARGERI